MCMICDWLEAKTLDCCTVSAFSHGKLELCIRVVDGETTLETRKIDNAEVSRGCGN